MLTALKEDGRLICLADFPSNAPFKALREKETFYCPNCKEKLILKIGTKKITHFAHKSGRGCCEQFENETAYHLSGKQKLYLWLKVQGLEPELEYFDREIRQRPDIRFTFENRRYALEYQCSVIPDEVFMKRTKSYLEHQYTPIWILGGEFFSRKSSQLVNLSDFQFLCINSPNNHSNLSYYCSNSNQFILMQKIFPISIRKAMASYTVRPLQNLNLLDIINPQLIRSPTIDTWQKEISSFKQSYSRKPKNYRDPFLKELYYNHLHLSYLPPEVGLPLANSLFIRTPPAIWQGYLFLDCFLHRSPGEMISFRFIEQAFNKRVWKKHISIRELPLIGGNGLTAVREYLCVLRDCGYLTEIDSTTFSVKRRLEVATNMIEQAQREQSFFQYYKSTLRFLHSHNDFT